MIKDQKEKQIQLQNIIIKKKIYIKYREQNNNISNINNNSQNKNVNNLTQKKYKKKPIQKTPENKKQKIPKPKEKTSNNNNLIDKLDKDKNTMGTICTISSTAYQTNIAHSITNNNIGNNDNISFENVIRTYSHENTKDDIIQNEGSVDNNKINKNSSHKKNMKNINNINVIDNSYNNKNKISNNYLYNNYEYNNQRIIKKEKINNPNKLKKNIKNEKEEKHAFNSDNLRYRKQEPEFNICKFLITDSYAKKNYGQFLQKKENIVNDKNININNNNTKANSFINNILNYTNPKNKEKKNNNYKIIVKDMKYINMSNENKKNHSKKIKNYKTNNIKINMNSKERKERTLNRIKTISNINNNSLKN